MLDATERSRPILQYVRELESKVRVYQQREWAFNVRHFAMGFLWGVVLMAVLWEILRLLRG